MSQRKKTLVGRRVLLSNHCQKLLLSRIKTIEFNRVKTYMLNMHKIIKYNKVSGGRNLNTVVCEFATDNGDHTVLSSRFEVRIQLLAK